MFIFKFSILFGFPAGGGETAIKYRLMILTFETVFVILYINRILPPGRLAFAALR